MRTIKLVIVGDSHTGKTSLRTQYITGRFSTGYRATLGADFYSKNVPHYRDANEQISLQIWDTAGQERFSSLSRAFFRGADAVLLVFDANTPSTLESLRRWWETFCDYAPVPEDEAHKFCTVFVGNKVDLLAATEAAGKPTVSEAAAEAFIDSLFPVRTTPRPQSTSPYSVASDHARPETPPGEDGLQDITNLPLSDSIEIQPKDVGYSRLRRAPAGSRATSMSRLAGTMTSTRTGLSVYHTPSSSLFNSSSASISTPSSPTSPFGSPKPTHSRKRISLVSVHSTSSTVTPGQRHDDDILLHNNELPEPNKPTYADSDFEEPEEGPRLFFTSAKSGESVADVFEYVARRVTMRNEWEETHIRDSLLISEADSEVTIRPNGASQLGKRISSSCCT
ncbi:ras-domain-containing protein [Auriculariales sp. MPI-PUGE-AT-0066]|nr:ras-domain-containing protein [Auriculariales sp. MPI-PUGE-AT-0066]